MRFVPGKLYSVLKVGVLCLIVLGGGNACAKDAPMPASRGQNLGALEQDILQEINRVRTDPNSYATLVMARKAQYDKHMAQFGGAAGGAETAVFEEAVRALRATAPLPALTVARGLSLAARDHVQEAGAPLVPLEERLKRYGTWEGRIAENVAYGSDTAQRFVMQFVLDPDDAHRTQRTHLLQADLRKTGIACGPHPQHTTLCVVILARQYSDKTP